MKTSLSIILLLFYSVFSFGQAKKITVEFFKEGKQIELKEDFNIYFIVILDGQKIIFNPTITENFFTLPDFCEYTQGHIVFKYNDVFYGIGLNNFQIEQDMKWVIGFDKKPYNKEYYVKEAEDNKTKGVVYIEFHPLEKGQGRVTLISIIDFTTYFLESKRLIYD